MNGSALDAFIVTVAVTGDGAPSTWAPAKAGRPISGAALTNATIVAKGGLNGEGSGGEK